MATFPISDVAIIAAVLGLFFLAMAFYKSNWVCSSLNQTQHLVPARFLIAGWGL